MSTEDYCGTGDAETLCENCDLRARVLALEAQRDVCLSAAKQCTRERDEMAVECEAVEAALSKTKQESDEWQATARAEAKWVYEQGQRAEVAEAALAHAQQERDEARRAWEALGYVTVEESQRANTAEGQLRSLREDITRHEAAVPLSNHSISWKRGASWAFLKARAALGDAQK